MSKIHKKTKNTCLICLEETQNGYVLHKTRRQTHKLCEQCFVGYFKPKFEIILDNLRRGLKRNTQYVKCCGSYYSQQRNHCQYKININNLQIPNSILYDDLLRIQLVLNNDHAYICPSKKCGVVLIIEKDYFHSLIQCNGCQTTWCRYCMVTPYHDNKSCLEYELEHTKSKDTEYINTLIKEGKVKLCPVCKCPIIRNYGCNHMICASCKEQWCWLCGKIDVGYEHFNLIKGSVMCKGRLWEGSDIHI